MDSKTYEYMNERVEKYKRLEERKEDAEKSLKKLSSVILKYVIDGNGTYVDIPKGIREELKASTRELLERHIQDLEKQKEEI